ncbi:MAG: hypothetical protein ACP6IY_19445 [Promethearchaeia archaeon]
MSIKKFVEIFINPDKIIEYAKTKWSFLKFSLIIIIAGTLLGFNFFWSNFIINVNISMALIIFALFIIGIIALDLFIYFYILLLWILTFIFIKITEKRDKKFQEDENRILITRKNLFMQIKILSYCFLIPFLIYNLMVFILNLFLIRIEYFYVIAYINHYGKYILYTWILTLSLYATLNINKKQKFWFQLFIIISFIIGIWVNIIFIFWGTGEITKLVL